MSYSDGIPIEDVEVMLELLNKVVTDCPVRQYQYVAKAQAAEWARAKYDLATMGDEGVCELAGTLQVGMQVVYYDRDNVGKWVNLIRRVRGTDFELDVPEEMRGIYRNFTTMSPVVVRR